MVKFVFLTNQFYVDYSNCKEIEKKINRPHAQVQIAVDSVDFCIPMRSHITHPHVFWTDKPNKCGLDFSKTVIITDLDKYIDTDAEPWIRPNEFDVLRGKEYIIKQKLMKYIKDYKAAKARMGVNQNRILLNYSTLKYFEDYI